MILVLEVGITPTGELTMTITAGDLDANYTVNWYLGATGDRTNQLVNSTDPGNGSDPTITTTLVGAGTHQSVVTGLVEGTYWVEVIDNTPSNNTCSTSEEITLSSDLDDVILDIAAVATVDANDCTSPDDGSLTIEFTDFTTPGFDDLNDLQIAIVGVNTTNDNGTYTDANTPFAMAGRNTTDLSGTGSFTISDLAPDTYNITVTDINTGCVSATYQVEIIQNIVQPQMTAAIDNDNFCNGGNGYVTISVTSPSTAKDDYQFSWYTGISTNVADRIAGPTAGDDAASAGGDELGNLNSGTYTVLVETIDPTVDGFGCTNQIIVVVEDDPFLLTISGNTPSPAVDCTDPSSGSITIDELTIDSEETAPDNSLATTDANLTYSLYEGALSATPTTQASNVFNNLNPGTYFVTAQYDNSSTVAPGCTSPAVQIIIDDNAMSPTITLAESAANTVCDPSFGSGITPTGELTMTITAGDLDANYTINWYLGATGDRTNQLVNSADPGNGSDPTITTTLVGAGTHQSVVTGLVEGTYWVEVIDNTPSNNTCSTSEEITLSSDLDDVILDIAAVATVDGQ